jgi:hypothetical protein
MRPSLPITTVLPFDVQLTGNRFQLSWNTEEFSEGESVSVEKGHESGVSRLFGCVDALRSVLLKGPEPGVGTGF